MKSEGRAQHFFIGGDEGAEEMEVIDCADGDGAIAFEAVDDAIVSDGDYWEMVDSEEPATATMLTPQARVSSGAGPRGGRGRVRGAVTARRWADVSDDQTESATRKFPELPPFCASTTGTTCGVTAEEAVAACAANASPIAGEGGTCGCGASCDDSAARPPGELVDESVAALDDGLTSPALEEKMTQFFSDRLGSELSVLAVVLGCDPDAASVSSAILEFSKGKTRPGSVAAIVKEIPMQNLQNLIHVNALASRGSSTSMRTAGT